MELCVSTHPGWCLPRWFGRLVAPRVRVTNKTTNTSLQTNAQYVLDTFHIYISVSYLQTERDLRFARAEFNREKRLYEKN